MFVAIVTAPLRPACATNVASFSCCFALSTLWGIDILLSTLDRYSLFSTEVVPTRTGWPFVLACWISLATAFHFSCSVLKIWSF